MVIKRKFPFNRVEKASDASLDFLKELLRATHLLQVGKGVGGGVHSLFLLFILLPFLGARRSLLPCPLSPFVSRFLGFTSSICFWQLVVATSKNTLHLSPQSLLIQLERLRDK